MATYGNTPVALIGADNLERPVSSPQALQDQRWAHRAIQPLLNSARKNPRLQFSE